MDDLDGKLNQWIAAFYAARKHFAAAYGIPADKIDVQGAAVAKLRLDDPVALLDHEWTSTALIDLLSDVDFTAWSDVEEIVLETTILPLGTPRRLDEETIKQNGEQWRIHAYDPDPFPSLPHAHNLSTGLKMDLRNGILYRKTEVVGQLRRKELLEFRARIKRIALPVLDPVLATS